MVPTILRVSEHHTGMGMVSAGHLILGSDHIYKYCDIRSGLLIIKHSNTIVII